MRDPCTKCKEIAETEHTEDSYLQSSVRYLQREFSSEFMNECISLLMETRGNDSTETISKPKSSSKADARRFLERCSCL